MLRSANPAAANVDAGGVGTEHAIPSTMKAITTIDLNETTIAILAGNTSGARWEVYTVDSDGLESFSHYATAGESRQLSALAYGAELTTFAARRAGDAKHFGLFA